ncbi:DUF6689 family protein [Aliidiomarina sanyensis]|uniref:Uncharacterized protein n=1 Tax=Aliidiomarina sanyensis TaxID=1249555 RepID=A0A432WG17_9GAMM|nr:DUF6689 family protein [Aliidiomarina sanyensis]RUO32703.1 hypothetical protein CWE11_07975 [Aliidiomarina sanyensis]
MQKYFATIILALGLVSQAFFSAFAADVNVSYHHNRVVADVKLDPTLSFDFSIEFEQVVGLNSTNFQVTARRVSLTDPSIISRLPSDLTTLHGGFPVLITVNARPDRGFAFTGEAVLDLYTQSIDYADNLRMFRSHNQATFEDITTLTAAGSLRARGSTGQFSDFLILVDDRDGKVLVHEKARNLSSYLYSYVDALGDDISADLRAQSRNIEAHVYDGRYTAATALANNFIRSVERSSGDKIPDVWRSADDIENVKGELLTRARNLRFALSKL